MVKIHYVPADFMVLDMGEEDDDTPIILRRPFSTPPTRSSTLDLDKSTSNFMEKRYAIISIVILLMNSQRRDALEGDVDQPTVKGTNPNGVNGNMKILKNL
jgi:hypothetical protein